MSGIPWLERVTAFQVNPEMAKTSDIIRMAEELLASPASLADVAALEGGIFTRADGSREAGRALADLAALFGKRKG